MSHQASAGFHKSEQLTTLTLIGGRDCIPGALLSQQSPDLWVHGGAIIEKNLCVAGNIGVDGYIIGNICADRALIGTLEEKHINEGINVIGDMNFNCGNVTNIGYLSVQTIAAANDCGAGNTLHLGSDVTVFGDLEVGANLIVNQSTILEGELHVVGKSYFNGNITAGHIDATSVCTPVLECVETITGPGDITINPVGNVIIVSDVVVGNLTASSVCTPVLECVETITGPGDITINPVGNVVVESDVYFQGNVYGITFPTQGNVFGNLTVLDKLVTNRLCVLEDTELFGNVVAHQNVTIDGDTYFFGNVYGLPPSVTSWSAGTTGFQPNTATTGDVVMSGTLNTTNGGTGLSSYTTGDMLYASAPNVLAPLNIGTNGQMLTVSGGLPTWVTPGMGGTVTSVGLTAPTSVFNSPATNSPITTSGTLDLTFITQSANTVFAGPTSGGAVVPTFRSLVVADLPTGIPNANLQNSSVTVNGSTGLSVSGSPVSLGGVLTLTNTGVTSAVAGTGISVSASTGAVTISNVGVTSVIAGSGISVSSSTGSITITSTGGGGTVTSVGLTAPTSVFNSPATGSPITTAGTLGLTFITQSANTVFAGPTSGGAVVPTFRSLVVADLPTGIPNANLQNSSITVNGSTGLSVGGSPVSLGGVLTLTNTGVTSVTAGSGISVSASTGAITISSTAGGGSVTSVGLSAPAIFSVSGSPVITSGTLTFTSNTQSANTVYAGPSTGPVAVPTFRSLVVADLPTGIPNANLQNSSITVNGSTGLSVSGSPVSLGGVLTLTNTGVTSVTAGTGISVSASTGAVTITATGASSALNSLTLAGPSSSEIWGTIGNNVYKYNPTTGKTCFVGPTGLSTDVPYDIAFHPNGTLYAVTDTAKLYTINTTTGAATFVANVSIGGTNSMTFDSSGVCYINTSFQDLATLNITTGVATVIGTIQTPGPVTWTGAGDLVFFNGVLYYTTLGPSFALINVNVTTPSASTVVGALTDLIFGLAVMNVGGVDYLYGLSGNSTNIYRIDETTGAFTQTLVPTVLPGDVLWRTGASQVPSLTLLGDQLTYGRSNFYDKVTITKDCSNEGDCVPTLWWANALTDELHVWNTLTNTDTLIGTLSVSGINNFAYFDGVLYGLSQSMLPGSLYTINTSTAVATLMTTFTFPGGSAVSGFNGFDIAPSGQFYATTSFSAPAPYTQQLVMLFPSTSAYTLVGEISDDGGTTIYAPKDLQFVQNDLYVVSTADDLLKINLANPLYSTNIATVSISLSPLSQIITGNECKLYGFDNAAKTWYNINLTTGVASDPSGTLPGLISVVGATSTATAEAALCVNGDLDMLGNDIYNAALVESDNAIVNDLLVLRSINGSPYSVVVLDANATPYAPTIGDTKGVWYGLNTKANAYDSTSITIGNGASTKSLNAIAIGVDSLGLGDNSVTVGINSTADIDSVGIGSAANQGVPYTIGTAAQSGGTVTGSGTNFRVEMVNGTIVFSTGEKFLITGYTSATSLSVFPTTPTVLAGTSFELYYSTQRTSAVGTNACQKNRTTANTAMGYNSLALNQQGTEITSIGYRAMYQQDGSYSVAVGGSANYGSTYDIGTASQSGTTVTGVGTTFTAAMTGGRIVFANNEWATITLFVSATQLTVSPSQTVSSQAFVVYFPTSGVTAVGYSALTSCRAPQSTALGYQSLLQAAEATYTKGTAGTGGVSSTTVTGVSTAWYTEMATGTIVFTGGVVATITSVSNGTTMVVSPAVTVANGTAYTVYLPRGYNTAVGASSGPFLTTGASNIMIGANSGATTNGTNSLVSGSNNTLIGGYASCYPTNDETVALGYKAKANESGSMAIGSYAVVNPTMSYSLAIGYLASVSTTGPAQSSCIAIGTLANASTGQGAIAIGLSSVSSGTSCVAIGPSSTAGTLTGAIAIGSGSQATQAQSISIGRLAFSLSTNTTCIGYNTRDWSTGINTNDESVVIGFGAATGFNTGNSPRTVVIGSGAVINNSAPDSIAIGPGATIGSSLASSIAIGDGAQTSTTGSSAIAIGTTATTNAGSTISIGNGSVANVTNSIAIGTAATTGTVAGGSAGLAITVPGDTVTSGDPGAATDALVIMINGIRYKIHLTAF
jgi:hypothetical protein